MYNYKPKLAEVDPENPNMWLRCGRCGFITNSSKAVWQWDFRGTPSPINTRVLTCGRPTCLDVPNPQQAPIILSPDPEPVFNARPFPYELSETTWLSTESGNIIDTEGGSDFVTPIPNASDIADTVYLLSELTMAQGQTLTVLYLDIFDGNPLTTGRSVLATITGSATRTDIFSQITVLTIIPDLADPTTTTTYATNTDTITVAAVAQGTTNVNYLAFYNAPTGGNIILSAALNTNDHANGVFPNLRGTGRPVVFGPQGIIIKPATGVAALAMITEGGILMITQSGVQMVGEGP